MGTHASDTAWYSYTSSTQTMKTWVRALQSFDDVPQEFREAFPKYHGAFPYTLLIPGDKLSFLNRRDEKILCLHDDCLTYLESQRQGIKILSCPLADLVFFEQGKVLLHSWITFYGASEAFTVEFNTTIVVRFDPIINAVSEGMLGHKAKDVATPYHQQEMAKFDYLTSLNFKYMNYGRKSIRPGDSVIKTLYQPQRCIRTWTVFHKPILRQYATSHLSILTEREMILIKESQPTCTDRTKLYGGVFTHIPRHRIQAIAFTPNPDNSARRMEITLSNHMRLQAEFSLENEEVEAFQQAMDAKSL